MPLTCLHAYYGPMFLTGIDKKDKGGAGWLCC